MKEAAETLSRYIEKLLPPYQFWAVLSIVSTTLLLLPQPSLSGLGLTNFVNSYRGSVSLVLISSAAILLVKGITYFNHRLRSFETVDTNNLSDEEKAVLLFFKTNQHRGFRARRGHPAIRGLTDRGFINVPRSPITVLGSEYDYYALTTAGKKKLSSNRFLQLIESAFHDHQQILNFINTISDERFAIHTPHQFD